VTTLTTRRRTAAALGAAAVLVVGGCSRAPEVAAAPGADTAACQGAAKAYPDTVSRMARLDVAAIAAAAWGDPAVIARCGVPAQAPTEVQCVEVDGVGWIPEALSDGTRFTSFGTDPALEVLVPTAYAPEPLLLPAFTAAVRALPPNGLACR
jgi:hypothetical protein